MTDLLVAACARHPETSADDCQECVRCCECAVTFDPDDGYDLSDISGREGEWMCGECYGASSLVHCYPCGSIFDLSDGGGRVDHSDLWCERCLDESAYWCGYCETCQVCGQGPASDTGECDCLVPRGDAWCDYCGGTGHDEERCPELVADFDRAMEGR